MYIVLNLLSADQIDIWRVCSILGYCLLPVIGLAFLGIVISLKSSLGASEWRHGSPLCGPLTHAHKGMEVGRCSSRV
jgi:hypothetical protein